MGTSPHTPLPIAEADFTQTGYSYTLSLIQGKHKMVILYCLMEYEPVRFNEMRRYLGRISDKTLSVNLKELERDGLIARTEYPQIPPKVEYSLTDLGAPQKKRAEKLTLSPLFLLASWKMPVYSREHRVALRLCLVIRPHSLAGYCSPRSRIGR